MSNENDRRAGHLDAEQRAEVLGNLTAALNGPEMYGRQGATAPSMQEITNSKCVEHLQKELTKQIEAARAQIVSHTNEITRLEQEIDKTKNYAKLLEEIQKRLK